MAVRRPSTYYQYILNSSDGLIQRIQFGRSENDIPLASPINTRMSWASGDKSLLGIDEPDSVEIETLSHNEFEVTVDIENTAKF